MTRAAGLTVTGMILLLAFIPACNSKNSQPQEDEWVELINGKDFTL
jgi:hypothetical protein